MPTKKLDLRGQRNVKVLPRLPSSLEEIDLRGTSIRDLAPLAALPRLRSLNLRGAPVSSLEPIFGVATVQYLWAEKTRLTAIEGISGLRALRLLWLHDTQVTDLAPLAGLRALEELDVAGLRPESWAFLPKLRSLTDLDLLGSSFADLALVERLPKLEMVRLAKTRVKPSADGVAALDAKLRRRGGGVSFENTPHWRAAILARLDEAPAEAAASRPRVARVAADRRFWKRSSSFVETFTRSCAVLVRKGLAHQLEIARITVKRFKNEADARAYAEKVGAEARAKGFAKAPVRGIPAPDLGALA